jgi:hypothetical protein
VKVKLAILFFFFCLQINAQDSTSMWYSRPAHRPPAHQTPPQKPLIDKSKVFVGGNFGLQFGSITYLDLSPMVGYRISDRFSAGVGVTYQYLKNNFYNITTNVYGGRVFGRYFIRQNIFAHAEYNVLNLQAFDLSPVQRISVGSLLVGGGYIQRFAKNSGMTVMLLYNLTPSVYSPYQNPIIQVGMVLGL